MSVKLTKQEENIVSYLKVRNNQKVYWEELVQFSKNPTTVKLRTVQKTVAALKRKFMLDGTSLPFNISFSSLSESASTSAQVKNKPEQVLVKLENSNKRQVENKHQVQIDFRLDPLGHKRVVTKNGSYQLNDSEWDMFKYFYQNPGKVITISELRDKLVYPLYGSKLPARWFDSIMRIVNNLRRQVVGLNERLLTVKGNETSYLFQ